jgi:hypothetical protein
MWNSIARQYNDIRGNLKWALLLGLWWVIVHFGKQMLQLIPHISQWMVWAIIVFASVVVFVLVARSNKQAQQPSTSVQVPGAIVPGIPTLSALLGQNPQINFDARSFLH